MPVKSEIKDVDIDQACPCRSGDHLCWVSGHVKYHAVTNETCEIDLDFQGWY